MTIASQIAVLQQDKTDIATAITNKGGTVNSGDGFDDFASDIGTITQLKGETRTVSITSTSGNTFTPSSGKNGITSIKVNPTNKTLSITPSTSAQTKTVPSGYSGYGTVSVSKVTSSIDSNIKAANIKSGISILGVTGTYEGGVSSKYGCVIGGLLGDISSGTIQPPNVEFNLVFSGVKTISSQSYWQYKFCGTKVKTASFPDLETISGSVTYIFGTCTSLTSVSFPKLKTILGAGGYLFIQCTSLQTISFPELTSVGGASCLDRAFRACTSLKTVTFSKLESITQSNTFTWAFSGCQAIKDIYFYGLKTIAQKDAFSGMMSQTGNSVVHTLHFPSNLQSTISGLDSYPLFGGTSGKVVLSFDLPATN